MAGAVQSMRRLLFRLWHGHADDVAREGRRLSLAKETTERAYAAGFRDGYFGALADLAKEGMVTAPPDKCVVVTLPASAHGSVH